MNWQLKTFSELTLDQLYELLQLRCDIFIVEQNCPYPELDGKDRAPDVQHLLGYRDNQLVACLRLLPPTATAHGHAAIGRVAIHEEARGDGLGHQLIELGVQHCQRLWPDSQIQIGAQTYLQQFYADHGFEAISEPYLEDDIPHIDMIHQR